MKIEIQVGQLVSLIGSVLPDFGPFCPLVSMPLVGNMSYFSNPSGPTDGVIILALAAGAGLCAILRRPVITALCGMASVGVAGTSYIMLFQKISTVKADMARELADNPFRGLAELAANAVQFQWGWAVLLLGGLMVAGGACLMGTRLEAPAPARVAEQVS